VSETVTWEYAPAPQEREIVTIAPCYGLFIAAEYPGEPAPNPPLWPDVSDHDPAGPGGQPFASGTPLDTLQPGPVLAAALDDALESGLDGQSDDALAGMILAARRCESVTSQGCLGN
jgi:hypothetical protein